MVCGWHRMRLLFSLVVPEKKVWMVQRPVEFLIIPVAESMFRCVARVLVRSTPASKSDAARQRATVLERGFLDASADGDAGEEEGGGGGARALKAVPCPRCNESLQSHIWPGSCPIQDSDERGTLSKSTRTTDDRSPSAETHQSRRSRAKKQA